MKQIRTGKKTGAKTGAKTGKKIKLSIIIASILSTQLAQHTHANITKELIPPEDQAKLNYNPYHESWSCKSIKSTSDSKNPPNKWACIRSSQSQAQQIFKPDLSKDKKQQALTAALGWIPDSSDTPNTCNTCDGSYYQYPFKQKNVPISKSKSIVDFSKFAENIKTHQLEYTGNVEIIQPSRVIYTDSATIDYNPKTSKPSIITAQGNLKLIQPGEMILADRGRAVFYLYLNQV